MPHHSCNWRLVVGAIDLRISRVDIDVGCGTPSAEKYGARRRAVDVIAVEMQRILGGSGAIHIDSLSGIDYEIVGHGPANNIPRKIPGMGAQVHAEMAILITAIHDILADDCAGKIARRAAVEIIQHETAEGELPFVGNRVAVINGLSSTAGNKINVAVIHE